MRIVLLWWISLLCLFAVPLQAAAPQTLTLFSREPASPLKIALSDSDWRWLGEKRQLTIAVYQPGTPPFDMSPDGHTYEGLSADYVLLVMRYLGMHFTIASFPSRNAALDALRQGNVDMLVDDGVSYPQTLPGLLSSRPYIPDHPALVFRHSGIENPLSVATRASIALRQDCGCESWVKQRYPTARITRYPTAPDAMSSVAYGENDYFIGSLTLANFLIERNFVNLLSIADIYPDGDFGPRFVFRQQSDVLIRAVNTVLNALTPVEHKVIFRHWSQGPNLWLFEPGLPLDEREKSWLARNQNISVVINPLDAPFTQLDDKQQFQGIAADVLRLIHLRTGLNFNAVAADNMPDMIRAVQEHKASFFAAASYSPLRDSLLLLTRPYVQPEFVLVVKDNPQSATKLQDLNTVAITPDNVLHARLVQQYPQVQFVDAKSASVAMKMVADGKAEGAIHNLIGARYMVDHYFPGKLKIASRVGDEPARISFAVGRDQPELYSILNKALADISPHDLSMIVNKWQSTSDAKLNTWQEYRHEFYWLAGTFAVLALLSLAWIFSLHRANRSRKETQARLLQQATFMETLFNGLQVPVYVTGRDGLIMNRNPAWDRFFVHMPEAISQLPLSHARHPLAAVWQQLAPWLDKPQQLAALPQRFLIDNGVERRVIAHQAVPFHNAQGRVAGLICSWQDMTDYEHLLAEASDSRERAEQANRSKSTFLATMSHEIRTPISAIIGLLELAVTSAERSEDQQESVRVAYDSAQSLMGLIGDILDMAKIESGRLELSPEWTPFSALTAPVVRVFDGLARQKGILLTCNIDLLHPDEIWIDPMRLRQVLSNLVSNAIKFTEQGTVAVQVNCAAENDQQAVLTFTVTDTGIGMAPEEQVNIFDPYVQAEEGKKQSGTGLGLAICQQLVAMMAGEITLHSQQGRGTRVVVTIPVSARETTAAPRHDLPAVSDAAQPLNILAVDDHPANRLLLKQQLIRLGHRVTEAHNGEQALIRWGEQHFDLVITDCNMPVMDGLALTRRLRAGQRDALTIFGLTANAQPEERLRCIDAGMDDCLFKPLRLPQLEALLSRVPRRHATALTLAQLLDLPALLTLTGHDETLLTSLLRTTLDENQRDLARAEGLLAAEAWPALAQSLHRLAGSARIVGATAVAEGCQQLEALCEGQPLAADVHAGFASVKQAVSNLNQAIAEYPGVETEKNGLLTGQAAARGAQKSVVSCRSPAFRQRR